MVENMMTVNIQSGTGIVELEIDEHGKIVWNEEVRVAHEYDVAFEAMGGSPSQLTEFAKGPEGFVPARLILQLFETRNQAIRATADAIGIVLNSISDDLSPSTVLRESGAISGAITYVDRYTRGVVVGFDHEGEWAYSDLLNLDVYGDGKNFSCSAAANLVNAAKELIKSITSDRLFSMGPHNDLELSPGTMSHILDALDRAVAAMAFWEIQGLGAQTDMTGWGDAMMEWCGRQISRLAELVHGIQSGHRSWIKLVSYGGES